MNLRQLEVFRAVMITGSTVGAAEMMHITQPRVSQSIQQFEKNCGVQLFVRRSGRIHPTPEAKVLFGEVERMFINVGRIERVARSLFDNRLGSLRLAAFPAIVRWLLPNIIANYCRDKPDLDVMLVAERSFNVSDLVARREVDLALAMLPADRDEVEALQIETVRAVCVLPASHRLSGRAIVHARDLEGEPFISLGRRDRSRPIVDKVFDALGVSRLLKIEVSHSEAACAFVGEGCGVSVVDPISVFGQHDSRIVIRPFEPAVLFGIWMLRPRAMIQPRLTQDFSIFLAKEMQALLASEAPLMPDRAELTTQRRIGLRRRGRK
jgi:DNA-binding transcriptional LysR family regulator